MQKICDPVTAIVLVFLMLLYGDVVLHYQAKTWLYRKCKRRGGEKSAGGKRKGGQRKGEEGEGMRGERERRKGYERREKE